MRREALLWGATIGALAYLSQWAFPAELRAWIRRRDSEKCQFPAPHLCEGQLEAHHLLPESYCKKVGIDPHFALNGLLLCRNAHQKLIHQDSDVANRIDGDGASKALYAHRADLLNQGQPYWNTTYDRQMMARAVQNTQRYQREHPEDPIPSELTPNPPKYDHSTEPTTPPRARTRI